MMLAGQISDASINLAKMSHDK